MSDCLVNDAEYQRLRQLREDAVARGHLVAAIAYGHAALRRGDELIVQLGGSVAFSPIAEALDGVLRK